MISSPSLADAFVLPVNSRRRILADLKIVDVNVPTFGSSFIIHLSELCLVACEHCMYASHLNAKSDKTSLRPDELVDLISLINGSHSGKLNITGGGEPFLKFDTICTMLRTVTIPRIEIVTAGYWGTTVRRARNLLARLDREISENPHRPDVAVRLSTDHFHVTAPNPLTLVTGCREVVETIFDLIGGSGGAGRRCQKQRPTGA